MKKPILFTTLMLAMLPIASLCFTQPSIAWTSSTTIGSGDARSIAWSPNGNQIVVARAISVAVVHAYDASTGTATWTYTFPFSNDRVNDFAYSPDGTILYCFIRANAANPGDINNRVARLNPADGTAIGTDWLPSPSGFSVSSNQGGVSLNAAGTRLAFAQIGNRVLTIFDTSDGSVIAQTTTLPGTGTTNVSLNPSGTQVVVATTGTSPNRAAHLYDISPGNLTLVGSTPDFGATPSWIRWAPNGNFIAVRGTTNILKLDPANITAAPSVLVSGLTSTTTGMLAISNDSSKIGVTQASGGVAVFNSTDGSQIGGLSALGTVRPIAFNPAGNSVTTTNSTGTTYRIDGFGPASPTLGSTVFLQGPNSGPLPRLVVGWRTSGSTVTLPTVTVDIPVGAWDVRAIGAVGSSPQDGIIWQNTDPAYLAPGLVAVWSLANTGVPAAEGIIGAPPSIAWRMVGYADLNGDGNQDVLFHNTSTNLLVAWMRDGSGAVTGTPVIGEVPAGWNPILAARLPSASNARIFFQQGAGGLVAMWEVNSTPAYVSTVILGSPGGGFELRGLGTFSGGTPALLFQSDSDPAMRFWNIDANGTILSTGALSEERPTGWNIVGVGRL
ncbi:MAG: WD40 repeat domain-containing protein [Fimbriimonadaceae bacterium]